MTSPDKDTVTKLRERLIAVSPPDRKTRPELFVNCMCNGACQIPVDDPIRKAWNTLDAITATPEEVALVKRLDEFLRYFEVNKKTIPAFEPKAHQPSTVPKFKWER